MKITLEVTEEQGVKTIWLDTLGFKPSNINLHSVISDIEIETIKTLILKLFTKQDKTPVFDSKSLIGKVFKKQPQEDLIVDPTISTKFKIEDYVRVIAKNTKMMNHVGKITKIKNNMYNVEFDANTSDIFNDVDLELVEELSKMKIDDFVKYKIHTQTGYGKIIYFDQTQVKIDSGIYTFTCLHPQIELLDKDSNGSYKNGSIVQVRKNKSFEFSERYGLFKTSFGDNWDIDFGDVVKTYNKKNVYYC